VHVHRRLDLPDRLPRPLWTQKADDVGILRPRVVDDDAFSDAQLLTAAIQREYAACYIICKCSLFVHVYADFRVSLTVSVDQSKDSLTPIAALL